MRKQTPHMKPRRTKKNCNRGAALEWSVGKLLRLGGGGAGYGGFSQFYSLETSSLSPDDAPNLIGEFGGPCSGIYSLSWVPIFILL